LNFLNIIAGVLAVAAVVFLIGERGVPRISSFRLLRRTGFGLGGLHAYVYGRWTKAYLKALSRLPSGPNPGRGGRWLAERWHAKVLPLEHASAIVTLDRPVERRNLERVIPYRYARDLVLNGPPDIAVYECACRTRLEKHCEPTQVCMIFGQPMVDFMLEHHPTTARRLSQAEAMALLEAEHEVGHVHCAWFKLSMLNRFYAICNCCTCCCAGMHAHGDGIPMLISSGYVARSDANACIICRSCVDICPFGALSVADAGIACDDELCLGCGVCEGRCPQGGMKLVRDASKPEPLDVRALV
jgi:ferredoxin